MFRGDTFVRSLTVFQRDYPTAPQNIAGWTFWFTVKAYASLPDSMALFQANSTDDPEQVTIDSAAAGKLTVRMPAEKTRGLADGRVELLYDVQGKTPEGEIRTVESGRIRVTPDITRAV